MAGFTEALFEGVFSEAASEDFGSVVGSGAFAVAAGESKEE